MARGGVRPRRLGRSMLSAEPAASNREAEMRATSRTNVVSGGERNGRPPPLTRSSRGRTLDLEGRSHFSPVPHRHRTGAQVLNQF